MWLVSDNSKQICAQHLQEISFLCFWEISGLIFFQLMEHGTNTLHVAFIFWFSINVTLAHICFGISVYLKAFYMCIQYAKNVHLAYQIFSDLHEIVFWFSENTVEPMSPSCSL